MTTSVDISTGHPAMQPAHAAKRFCHRDLRRMSRHVVHSGEGAGFQVSDRGCVQVQGSTRSGGDLREAHLHGQLL